MPFNPLYVIIGAIIIVLALGFTGASDAQDQQLASELYCAEVHAGEIPDYLERYDEMCIKGKVRPQH